MQILFLTVIFMYIIEFQDEDNEFEHFQDPEEFEGLPDSAPHTSEQPKITISKVFHIYY